MAPAHEPLSEGNDACGAVNDPELQELFRNLGGHDFAELRDAFAKADAHPGPRSFLAYTQKGWMLPPSAIRKIIRCCSPRTDGGIAQPSRNSGE